MIELKNISKSFKTSKKVVYALEDVSLKIKKGDIFGVIGTSGAGKSTLIRCINLLEKPNRGEVWIDGVNLVELNDSKLTLERRKIGMIFQHFNLLSSRTVFDNIAFPLELIGENKDKINKKVKDLLEIVGISDKANEYPVNLSGGQKQRVAIARALASDPSILLCDEATSALDPATTKSILNLLKEINQKLNLTIVLITHEMEVINAICDKVAVIEAGKLVEEGTVEEIFTNPKYDLTKEFINNSLDISLPLIYQNKIEDNYTEKSSVVYKLTFNNLPNFNQSLHEINLNFGTETEIINSRIEYAGSVNYGTLFLKVNNPKEKVETINNYLIGKKFNTEIIGYVRNSN